MTEAPAVLLGGNARLELRAGVAMLADVVRRTLGPRAGAVCLSVPGQPLEVHRSSAMIARRMISVPSRAQSVGVMLLRHGVWRMHREVGDGGATTAALLHDMLQQGVRVIESGADPRRVEAGMRVAGTAAAAALRAQARPLAGEQELTALLRTGMIDDDICTHLGEIFTALGPDAGIAVEEYVREGVAHELVVGSRWEGHAVGETEPLTLDDPLIMVTDQELADAQQVARILDLVLRAEGGPLVIFARDVSAAAQAAIVRNRGAIRAAAVTLDVDPYWQDHLEDIAVATGATFLSEAGCTDLGRVRVDDLGYAQRFDCRNGAVKLLGGAGREERIADRRLRLKHELGEARDEELRATLRRRLANVQGRSAVLEVGGATQWEREERVRVAERAARLAPQAFTSGVVAGGGAALVHCQRAMACTPGADADERAGIKIVRDALAAPMRWLLRSAGAEADVVERVRGLGPGSGYDLERGEICCMHEAGVIDTCGVVEAALRTAVSLSILSLTVDAMVLLRKPAIEVEP